MPLLALIRHGPTAWNRDRRLQGRADIPLDDAGRAQVRAGGPPAGLAAFDWVSSPLVRARETAALLAGRAVPAAPALAEMDWGEWEGRRLADLRRGLGPQMAANEARGLDFLPPGGESPRMVQARIAPWLEGVAAHGRPLAAVTHRGVIRALYALAVGWDMTGRPPVRLDSNAVHVFRVGPDGLPTVRALNLPLGRPDP